MAATRRGRAPRTRPVLPPITLGRFTAATDLIGPLTEETADEFLRVSQRYRERHADYHPERQPNAQEAAQLAAALLADGQDPVALAERIQGSDLRVQDRPDAREMLAVAAAATVPAVVKVGTRLYALLAMPADEFRTANELGRDDLDAALDAACADLADLDMARARELGQEAFGHFLRAAGAAEGNAWGLIAKIVGQAWEMALGTMGPQLDRLTSSSLTGSPPSTDGVSTTSSTSFPIDES